jgi:hypothetical protein
MSQMRLPADRLRNARGLRPSGTDAPARQAETAAPSPAQTEAITQAAETTHLVRNPPDLPAPGGAASV